MPDSASPPATDAIERFIDLTETQKEEIGRIAEALDAHRKAHIAAHPKLTMTGLYNVLNKVAAAPSRSPKTKRQDADPS